MTHEVEVCIKGSIKIQVQATSQDDAEEQALEHVKDLLPPGFELSYLEAHRTRKLPAAVKAGHRHQAIS